MQYPTRSEGFKKFYMEKITNNTLNMVQEKMDTKKKKKEPKANGNNVINFANFRKYQKESEKNASNTTLTIVTGLEDETNVAFTNPLAVNPMTETVIGPAPAPPTSMPMAAMSVPNSPSSSVMAWLN